MKPVISPYNPGLRDRDNVVRPLLISSSGGGGHLSAINGIIDYLYSVEGIQLELVFNTQQAEPVTQDKRSSETTIKFALRVQHELGLLSTGLCRMLEQTRIPIFPSPKELYVEVSRLRERKPKDSLYVDVLLDVFGEAGFLSAAIVNVLARKDDVKTLKKLIAFHSTSDSLNRELVSNYFFIKLKTALENNRPYTEIISTQAMCLKGIASAVQNYNEHLEDIGSQAPRVFIQQYMTDLPSAKAQHFFSPLNNLPQSLKSLFCLYGRGLTEAVIREQLKNPQHYKAVYNIPADKNPMVRSGFYDKSYHNHLDFAKKTMVTYQTRQGESLEFEQQQRAINADEKVASIILGSQASQAMVDYLQPLLRQDYKHIFLFCSGNQSIVSLVKTFIGEQPALCRDTLKEVIVCLDVQDDTHMTSMFTRSNIIIMRGGGLSVMEQMALPHHVWQRIYYHQSDSDGANGSGLVWEDGNIQLLQDFLDKIPVYSERVTPAFFAELERALDSKADEHIERTETGKAKEKKHHPSLLSRFSLFKPRKAIPTARQEEQMSSQSAPLNFC